MDRDIYDICVIGGGINGCGIARDAVGRGYKVLLLEQGDLASGTSSASTKLIHGGLRYLEQYDFGLVRKALKERETLAHLVPHITKPLQFIVPHVASLRPFWMIRLGVFLYDHLFQSKKFKKSFKTNIKNKFLTNKFKCGVAYSDAWVDDARLVVLNAMDAKARGADIRTGIKVESISHEGDVWCIKGQDGETFYAQMIVNAAGPWASQVMGLVDNSEDRALRLVKGSHIIVPRLYFEYNAYVLQNTDKRIVFTIPYEGDFTLIGTTDVDISEDDLKNKISINKNEIKYLKDIIKVFFEENIKDSAIVDSYAGVRALAAHDAGEAAYASRDYDLDLQVIEGRPLLSVLGGKLTTYRILAEEAVDKIDRVFHKNPHHWTSAEKLPGGDIIDDDIDRFVREQVAMYPFLSTALLSRYARSYGTCMDLILNRAKSLEDMGQDLGGGVYGRELDYLQAYEFAKTGEDVLKRRTKLYLHLDDQTQKNITKYMKDHQ